MIYRVLLVAIAAAALAVQAVRNAAVDALSRVQPATAAKTWPGHPRAEVQLGLTQIAESARAGRPVDQSIFASIFAASVKAPLLDDPFLVRGVQAQIAGDMPVAERSFVAAKRRDPRSLPARYFLADHYLRQRDALRGLPEVTVLARLVPGGVEKVAPYVASYALNRKNWPVLRRTFQAEPALEGAALSALATEPANADLVLALSSPARRTSSARWVPVLLDALGSARDFGKARQIWASVAKVQLGPNTLLYDPDFRDKAAPPPFNWSLTSSAIGLAERQAGGGLHVIYYGQQDGPLASQLLVLPAGRYRMQTFAPALSEGADALHWALVCMHGNATQASMPLDEAVRTGFTFTVPPSCSGQRLELVGRASDLARQVDVTIRGVRLARGG